MIRAYPLTIKTVRHRVLTSRGGGTYVRLLYDTRPCHFSLPPRPPKTSTSTDPDPLDPPPPLPTSKKPKVGLRPGPVKSLPSSPNTLRTHPSPSQLKPPQTKPLYPSISTAEFEAALLRRDIIHNATQHTILKPPPPNSTWFQIKLHTIREIAKFYWRGIKMIFSHRQHVSEIRTRIQSGGHPLTRWESRFIQTYSRDIKKLVPFILIISILEELIPLLIIFAPNALPSTCILPSQRLKIAAKKTERQKYASEAMRVVLEAMRASGAHEGWVDVQGERSRAICGMLQLSTLGTGAIRTWRIRRHLKNIVADDVLLRTEDFGAKLTEAELTEALQERGIMTTGISIPNQRSLLRWWLDTVDATPNKGDEITRRVFAIVQNLHK